MKERNTVVLTVGPAYAGKTAVSGVLQELGYPHFSTKKELDNDPEIQKIIASGKPVCDKIVIPVLDLHLPVEGHVNIDSPRSVGQAKWLTAVKYPCNKFRIVTLFLAADKTVLLERLSYRIQTQPGRIDDNIETGHIRLGEYEAYAPLMLAFLRRTTEFHEINANLALDYVGRVVRQIMGRTPSKQVEIHTRIPLGVY